MVSIMLVRLDLKPTVSLFQHKCEVSETISTTTPAFLVQISSDLFQALFIFSSALRKTQRLNTKS